MSIVLTSDFEGLAYRVPVVTAGCLRHHPQAKPSTLYHLMVDTGSTTTVLPARALPGVEVSQDSYIVGIGERKPAGTAVVHFMFPNATGRENVLTARVSVLLEGNAEGCIGLDVIRQLELCAGRAYIMLGQPSGHAVPLVHPLHQGLEPHPQAQLDSEVQRLRMAAAYEEEGVVPLWIG